MIAHLAAATLTVFAAASLRESFTKIAAAFEAAHPGAKVLLSFAGSQELAAQIDNGAPADVFAAADLRSMHGREARVFARNTLALVVPEGNPRAVRGLQDLARLDRVVLAAPEVPAGHYAREVLARRGIDVSGKIISNELNVRQVAQKVVLGEADAGIVYRTDAFAFAGKLARVDLPQADNVVAEYPVAPVSGAPAAKEFVAFLFTAPARAVLESFGFAGVP